MSLDKSGATEEVALLLASGMPQLTTLWLRTALINVGENALSPETFEILQQLLPEADILC